MEPPPHQEEALGPFQALVNRENVTRDVVGQRRVYDIISVLPPQRYGVQVGTWLECGPRGLDGGSRTSLPTSEEPQRRL